MILDFSAFTAPERYFAMACTLYKIDEIANAPQRLIFGDINRLQIYDRQLDSLIRLGSSFYGNLGELLVAQRPN